MAEREPETKRAVSPRWPSGVRWLRSPAFRNDPDVSDLYRELLERGEIDVDDTPHRGVVGALRRRAAEDGLQTGQSFRPPRFERIALVGPLEERDLTLASVHEEAKRLYRAAMDEHSQWAPGEIGRFWPQYLYEHSLESELRAELTRLATADAVELSIFEDEFSFFVVLGPR
jgi:hypothetical protein